MIKITNDSLEVTIAEAGAELQSIYNKQTNLEYMWSGDPAFWGKKSPVLFPVIGGMKNNSFQYKGNTYTLPRHGFAREQVFEVAHQTADSVTFSLATTAETLQVYPFQFKFSITYSLRENTLDTTYMVENNDEETMYFSVGAHPAFKVPLVDGEAFADSYIECNETENAPIYRVLDTIVVDTNPTPFFDNTNILPLTKELFYGDALVFKELKSTAMSIRSKHNNHGLTVSYEGFPFMGIWSAKDADFVCIEPWCGIADRADTTGILQEKEGINQLAPNANFSRTWSATMF